LGELAEVRGDRGGRDLLARHADRLYRLALPGRRAVTDLDTPEDWARWRGAPS
jgi:CTP:molybdopterin cytidylyltransferase MocA